MGAFIIRNLWTIVWLLPLFLSMGLLGWIVISTPAYQCGGWQDNPFYSCSVSEFIYQQLQWIMLLLIPVYVYLSLIYIVFKLCYIGLQRYRLRRTP